MMNNLGLQSEYKERSENSLENQLEPVVGTSPENSAVKIEENREDGEYFEEEHDTKHGLLDVKPKVERDLDIQVRPDDGLQVMINRLKAQNKRNCKTRADLRLAKEREKELLEEMEYKDEEMKSKDVEILVLKQSVEYWKKKAASRRPGQQIKEQFESPRECYARVNKVKMPFPPWRSPGETGSPVSSHGGGDAGISQEHEGAGGELEEEQGGQVAEGEVVQEENRSDRTEYKKGIVANKCNACKKIFSCPRKLKRHKLVHTGKKHHTCHTCKKAFSQKSDLKNHKMTHSGKKPFSCDECTKSFTLAGNLKIHKLTHSGEKPHTCNICTKSFAQAWSLKMHKLTHSGEKPFSCDECTKSFSQARNLKNHKLTHSGEQAFSCNVCAKSFARADGLKLHKMTHGGKKPHICGICQKGFTRHERLKVHKLKHNLEEDD